MSSFPAPGRRISIRGTSGSGKSTLGKALAQRYGIPYIELDAINHLPNWQEIDPEEFRRVVAEIVAGDAWVIDGNYAKVRDLVMDRCDTVLWLDYPLAVVLSRLLRRIVRRGLLREELWNGNREAIWRHFFTRDSLILWVLTTHRKRQSQADEVFKDRAFADRIRIRFTHPREADVWLRSLSGEGAAER